MEGTKSNQEGCPDWSGLAPSRTFDPARGFEYRQRTSSAMVQLVHDVVPDPAAAVTALSRVGKALIIWVNWAR
jgi:hypothetical protein